MTPTIDVDPATYSAIDLAARLTSLTHSEVVARLIGQSRMAPVPSEAQSDQDPNSVAIYVDYAGHRTNGMFDRLTHRIDIADGPLAGTSYKSPSSAARAVVSHYKPGVSPHRNGWSFWILDDGTGRFVQSIRHS